MSVDPTEFLRVRPVASMLGLDNLSLEQIQNRLQEYDREWLLEVLSNVNLLLHNTGFDSTETQVRVGKVLLPSSSYGRAEEILRAKKMGAIFNQGQTRDLIRFLLTLPPTGTRPFSDDDDRKVLTEALLSIGDSTSPELDMVKRNGGDRWILGYQLGNFKMFMEGSAIRNHFTSTDYTVTEVLQDVSIAEKLTASLGFPPPELLLPPFLLMAFYNQFDIHQMDMFNSAANEIEFLFAEFGVSKSAYKWFNENCVHGWDAVCPYRDSDDPYWRYRDYFAIYERPYMRMKSGKVICLDSDFADQRLTLMLQTELDKVIDKNERKSLLGRTCEAYVRHLIGFYKMQRRGVTLASSPSEPQLDCGWQENGITVLAEVKSDVIPFKTRYSLDRKVIKDHLDNTYVGYDADGNAIDGCNDGIAQLLVRLKAYLENPSIFGLKATKHIVLALIVKDTTLSGLWLSKYLAHRFYELVPSVRVKSIRFAVIHYSELETLVSCAKGGSVADALFGYGERLRHGVFSANMFVHGIWERQTGADLELPKHPESAYEKAFDIAMNTKVVADVPRCEKCSAQYSFISRGQGDVFYCMECKHVRPEPVSPEEREVRDAERARIKELLLD